MSTVILSFIKRSPVLGWMLKRRFEQLFLSAQNMNLFYGVYSSHEEASAALPRSKPLGYDNEASAMLYEERAQRLHYTDYPPLFWLQKLLSCPENRLTESLRIFDYGGHIGVSYYSYSNIIKFPAVAHWVVYDVPAVVEQGRKYAAERGDSRIEFVTTIEKLNYYDVFFASGSPQYSPDFFADLNFECMPRFVLLNMVPCTNDDEIYTLNNIGTAFCVYHIFNKREFEKKFMNAGYSIVAHWHNEGKICDLSYSTRSEAAYYGWFLKKN